jgi:carboxymethylenebutenolidase
MNDRPKITQEMIRLYDEYTHLTLDRRGFMAKLAKLSGSAAAASAIVPMLAGNYAKAQVVAADDPRLKIEDVTFPGPAGGIRGYLAIPSDASGPLPAVLVIHENRGLTPHIQDVTRRMALEGFVVLGVDLLSRQGGTPASEDEARELFQSLDRAGLVEDSGAAVAYLQEHPSANGSVGAVGFCFGGGMVNQLAVASPDLDAGVAYYGGQPPADQVDQIEARMMLHYAGLDERINAGIAEYEEALKAAGVDYELFMYDGAQHAFNNDTSEARYNKEAADLAWSRTVEFLRETLAGS